MSDERIVDAKPDDNPECSERELESLQGGTIVDEPDPFGRKGEPLPIIEGPDPI